MKSTICMLLAILTVMLCTAHAEINARGIWEMQSFFDGNKLVSDPQAGGTGKKVIFFQDGTAKVTIIGNGKVSEYDAFWQQKGDSILLEYTDGDRGVFSVVDDQLVYKNGQQVQYFTKTAAYELKDSLRYFTFNQGGDKEEPYGFYIDENQNVQPWCSINRYMDTFAPMMSKWKNVVQLLRPVGGDCYMGVTAQGKVLCATKKNGLAYRLKFVNATEWSNIREIKQLNTFISGVGYDGKLHITPSLGADTTTYAFQKANGWKNIVDIVRYSGVGEAIACLTTDGYVRLGGANPEEIFDAANWSNIIQIASNKKTILGLSADGVVYQAGKTIPSLNSWGPVKCLLDDTNREFGSSEMIAALAADGSGFYILGSGAKYEWKGVSKMAYSQSYGMMGIDSDSNLAIYGWQNVIGPGGKFCNWHDLVDLRVHHYGILGLRADGVLLIMYNGKETMHQLAAMPLGW